MELRVASAGSARVGVVIVNFLRTPLLKLLDPPLIDTDLQAIKRDMLLIDDYESLAGTRAVSR